MHRIVMVLAVFCTCFVLPGRAATNLVTNGGFETGDFSLWTQSSTDFSFVDILSHSGTYAAWLGPVGSVEFLSQNLSTVAGQRYDLHYWLRHDPVGTGTPSEVQLIWDGTTIDQKTDLAPFDYKEFVHLSVMATGATTELKFGFREDTDYFQLDDVSVRAVPEPEIALLFGAGLLTLFGYRGRRSLSRAALAVLLLGAPCVQAQEITDFTPEGILAFLKDPKNAGVNSAAKFLERLPLEFKQHWIMMTKSESAQTGTATSPRFILPDAKANRVFGFALDSNVVEYLHFDETPGKFLFQFRFHEIDTGNASVEKDDQSCNVCHASERGVKLSRPRPNWDAYDSWGGMLPFNRDRIYENSIEATAFKKILTDLKDDPIVAQLKLPKGVTRDGTGAVVIAFAPCDPGIGGAPPCKTDPGAGPIPVKYAYDAAKDLVSFPGGEGPVNVPQGGKYLRLHHSLEGDATDQGRGVRLFDNFSDNNAKRVVQEIIDFPRKLDIRYIALAIADNCVTKETLGKFAPNGSIVKLLAHQADLDANVTSFDKLLADTRKRQKSLPLEKANLQTKNLKGLIQATGALPPPPTDPVKIVTEIARRSKETYRPAEVVTFMIDREDYDEQNNQTTKMAFFRLYLEGVGVAVDKWSLSVKGRSETYTFGDVLDSKYLGLFVTELRKSLAPEKVACKDLAVASVKQYLRGF